MDIEFTDRYQAMGVPYPDPETMCEGQCEGIGVYPHQDVPGLNINLRLRLKGSRRAEREAWEAEHAKAHTLTFLFREMLRHREWWLWKSILRDIWKGRPCDGWHFIKCPDCSGTGLRQN